MKPAEQHLQSLKGISYRTVIVRLLGSLILILLVVAVYKLFVKADNSPPASFFFIISGTLAWAGLWLYLFLPNTVKIVLLDEGIEISSRGKSDYKEYVAIKDVQPFLSTHYSSWFGFDIYRCTFFKDTQFGRTIYFRCNGGWFFGGNNEPDLGQVLLSRARWARHSQK